MARTSKPQGGRPPLPDGEARTELLRARATAEEKRRVAAYCEREETTEADLIRDRLADVLGGRAR